MAGQKQEKVSGFSPLPQSTDGAKGEKLVAPDVDTTLAELEKSKSSKGIVKVIHGANDEEFDSLVGMTVGEVVDNLKDSFNIPADAMLLVDGKEVTRDTVVVAGNVVEAIRLQGTKGLNPYTTRVCDKY